MLRLCYPLNRSFCRPRIPFSLPHFDTLLGSGTPTSITFSFYLVDLLIRATLEVLFPHTKSWAMTTCLQKLGS